MSHRPFIGITCDVNVVRGRENEYELVCDHRYSEAVKNAGGFPILLPIASRPVIIDRILNEIDGLIIVGGDDVDPKLYGERPKPGTGTVFHKRINFEKILYRHARQAKLPIMGICYGMQLINVLEGGTLYQDIKRDAKSKINHQHPKKPMTRVKLESQSRLYSIIHQKLFSVYCEHHQAVSRVAPGFRPVAFGKDGIIEAIENQQRQEVLAVQWHPERTLKNAVTRKLFRSFINRCR